jgi:hypothetical protein
MIERQATVVGFAVASALPALILAALSLTGESGVHAGQWREASLLVFISFLVFLPYSALFTLLFGVPSYLLCRRLGIVSWWAASIVGVLAGVLISLIVRSGNRPYAGEMMRLIPAAEISAIAFWAVRKWGSQSRTKLRG